MIQSTYDNISQQNSSQDQNQNHAKFSCLSFLNHEEYQSYYRPMARFCGSVHAAIMLNELVNRLLYHEKRKELISHEKFGGDWFYLTMEKCEERTCLTRREQDTGLKILKEKGLIECISFGLPAKRHFRIKMENVLAVMGLSKKESSLAENAKLDWRKTPNYDGGKRQTAPYIKEPKEEPLSRTTTTNTGCVDVDVHNSTKKEAAKALKSYLDNRIRDWGQEWQIPLEVYLALMNNYNDAYVLDQVSYMLNKQHIAIKDENCYAKKKKTERIGKPETYLRMACEKNYAMSTNYAK